MKEHAKRLETLASEIEAQARKFPRACLATADAAWLVALARAPTEAHDAKIDALEQDLNLTRRALRVTQDDWAAADRRAREQFERQQAEILSLQSQLAAARAEIAAGETLRESMHANTQRLLKLLAEKKR